MDEIKLRIAFTHKDRYYVIRETAPDAQTAYYVITAEAINEADYDEYIDCIRLCNNYGQIKRKLSLEAIEDLMARVIYVEVDYVKLINSVNATIRFRETTYKRALCRLKWVEQLHNMIDSILVPENIFTLDAVVRLDKSYLKAPLCDLFNVLEQNNLSAKIGDEIKITLLDK